MINKPRGTRDLIGLEAMKKEGLIFDLISFSRKLGFIPLEIPVYEEKDLFVRSVGDETDIVQKELFYIENKSDKEYALRPELTAGNVRALAELGLKSMPQPVRVYSYGKVFRYEKPQKGRYREISQFDMNIFSEKDALMDAYSISAILRFIEKKTSQSFKVYINSLGSKATKEKYQKNIRSLAIKNKDSLCSDCQNRVSKNALRVLDCKNLCREKIGDIKPIYDFMNSQEKEYFDQVVDFLKTNEINFEIDNTLVRGIDYYTGVIFEIASSEDKQRSSVVCGGGRFDNLVGELTDFEIGAFGYGIGIDRLSEYLDENPMEQLAKIKIVAAEDKYLTRAYSLSIELLSDKIVSNVNYRPSIKDALSDASSQDYKYLVIVGDEINQGEYTVKRLREKTQEKVTVNDISKYLMS